MLEQPKCKFYLRRRTDHGVNNDDDYNYEDGDNEEYNEYNNLTIMMTR